MKKLFCIPALLFAALVLALSASAAEPLSYTFTEENDSLARLRDGNRLNAGAFETATLKSDKEIDALYFLFDTKDADMTLTAGGEEKTVEGKFLHRYVKISELFSGPVTEVTVRFSERTILNEIYAFGEGELPDWVQVWEDPCEKADLMLFTTHADDEQLFFAGVLPTYAGERKLAVQVAYFTDHRNETDRRHELLNGLWTVGVTHYPVIGAVPDAYAQGDDVEASYNWALRNAEAAGFTEEALVASQTELLRRFKPLAVVGHDLNGEYHHGQHILNIRTLLKAVEGAGTEEFCPESAAAYGVWDVPKVYVHLYGENEILMDWDTPLETFGGKTAFQMTQEGFACHKSQQDTWFTKWIRGADGKLTRADGVSYVPPVYSTYTSVAFSPCRYGLYRTLVGADEEKNDFLEHIETWEAKAEREEEERLAEERRLEEERLAREAAEKEAAEKKAAEAGPAEEAAKTAESAQDREEVIIIVSLSIIGAVALVLVIRRVRANRRRMPRPQSHDRGNDIF